MAETTLSQRIVWRLEQAGYVLLTSLFRALPVDAASDFGAWLLRTLGPLNGANRTARINLKLAFPDLTDQQRDVLLRAQWEEFGRTMAEFPIVDRIFAGGRVEFVNIERLHAIRDGDKPVVFISGHFSNWEIMPAAIIASGVDSLMTYRRANNPYVDVLIKQNRMRYGTTRFGPKGGDGARDALDAMNEGVSVALMNDQKFAGGVKGPFFGVEVETAPGPTRMAIRFDTCLQPMTVERVKGARFRVIVHEPIWPDDTGNRTKDIETTVGRINLFLEECIRARPHEWFWTHRRWPKDIYRRDEPAV